MNNTDILNKDNSGKALDFLIDELKHILREDQIAINEPMRNHTTFRIGGPADIMVFPEEELQIVSIMEKASEKGISCTIIGNGSNILVSDRGIRGLVIKIADSFAGCSIDGNAVWAQAGIRLTALSRLILEAELEGFEFASGIPGTLGGGVYMNAGAYDSEMKNIVKSVRVIDREGRITELENEQMKFGYRKSLAMEKGYIVLSVCLELEKGSRDKIKAKIDDFTEKRVSKQPVSEFSAGSTFKRPSGHFAGKLIEEAGLRGYTKGDAKVSEKHCGFVINKGSCTFEEMIMFIEDVKRRVFENSGIMLEEEVRIIGER